MHERVILHVDCNAFYYSCEASRDLSLLSKPVVIGGDVEARHGIVLAKSDQAKARGIKTGNAIWQAKAACPNLIVLPPNYALYKFLSDESRQIFNDYSDRVEPFGLDESWIDVTGNETLDTAKLLADQIRERFIRELGISVSIGIANNKITAKLGSDYKKPNATTLIKPESYQQMVWPLPAEDLLYVGPSTKRKLHSRYMRTIGDICQTPIDVLRQMFGKNGEMLWYFANGLDTSPVAPLGCEQQMKSIGNSTTTPYDLQCMDDVKLTFWVLAESVAQRLRSHGFRCGTVQISIRDKELKSFERQIKLSHPTQLAYDLMQTAMALFQRHYDFNQQLPIRSVGLRGCSLTAANGEYQLSLFEEDNKPHKLELLENTIDQIRDRFGHFALMRGSLLINSIGAINPKDDHTIHPVSYFG